jgi:hypothetical protein
VKTGGLKLDHILMLGHSAAPYATISDFVRGWETLGPGTPMPKTNRISRRIWAGQLDRVTGENRYFGKLTSGAWTGSFAKQFTSQAWSALSRLEFTQSDWDRAWPLLLRQIDADAMTVVKRSDSGDVLAGELLIGGKPLPIIVKRPRRKFWYRYVNEIGRGSRPRRAWMKAWRALHSNLPTAMPMLLMERRRFGYVTDGMIVFERVMGDTLEKADLDALNPVHRQRLFHRIGRILRRIESFGWSHFDAKSSNWIVQNDASGGPYPVMVDIDGIRHRNSPARGLKRLLRSLLQHSQYTPSDSLALCRGYAPFSVVAMPQPDGDATKPPA